MAKDRFDIQEKNTMSLLTETMVIVDEVTGVNYLYVGLEPRPETMGAACSMDGRGC